MLTFPIEDQLLVIQTKRFPLILAVFIASVVSSTYVGWHARAPGLGQLNTGLWVLSALSGVVNATLALGLFPVLFTWLSRQFGAVSLLAEVQAVSALSLLPVILGTPLSVFGGAPLWTTLAGAGSLAVFAHGLSLANGTTFLAALRHTLAMWGLLVLVIVVLSVLVGVLASVGHQR